MNRFSDHDQSIHNPGSNLPRPFGVTLLALGVLSISVLNLVRLVLVISRWQFLSSLPGVSPLYIALTGLIWGVSKHGGIFGFQYPLMKMGFLNF